MDLGLIEQPELAMFRRVAQVADQGDPAAMVVVAPGLVELDPPRQARRILPAMDAAENRMPAVMTNGVPL